VTNLALITLIYVTFVMTNLLNDFTYFMKIIVASDSDSMVQYFRSPDSRVWCFPT
jgi:hypothetical protein